MSTYQRIIKNLDPPKDMIMDRAKINAANTAKQKDMHTCGPKSFARIREDLARMEEIASQQAGEHVEGGESSNPVDPFEAVMGKEHKGRLRLYGRGVTASTLGKVSARSSGASVYVPEELLKSIKEDVAGQLRSELRNELKTQVTQEVKDHWATEYCQTMAHQLKQLHPQLDINAEALRRLATATQSPGDASSAEHHRRGIDSFDMGMFQLEIEDYPLSSDCRESFSLALPVRNLWRFYYFGSVVALPPLISVPSCLNA
ncbi:hypothetical protein Dimus_005876 [Dionaea muscipula]